MANPEHNSALQTTTQRILVIRNISQGVFLSFFFHCYTELITTASAKSIEKSLLTNPREFFYLCAERKTEDEMRLEAADGLKRTAAIISFII
jgi:hypothetical protein